MSYSSSVLEVTPVSCPTELQSGERARIEYVIDNKSPQDINISSVDIVIDRDIKHNQSLSGFVTTRASAYPHVLNSTAELALGGEFNSKEVGTHYLDLALSYSLNKTSKNPSLEFYEVCKIDVVPFQSDSSKELQNSLGAIIAAAGAIAGGSVGSYFTYRYGKRIEDEKTKRENKRQEDFNTSIRDMVKSELETCTKFMSDILSANGSVPINLFDSSVKDPDALFIKDDNLRKNFNSMKQSLPKQYDDLTVERKANIFAGSSLNKIQKAYQEFFNLKLKQYGKYPDCLSRTEAKHALDIIEEAIASIT